MDDLSEIRNFLWMNDRLGTGGMPKPEQFLRIREAGFDTVINLALPTSDNALANEGEIVSKLGMSYIHIPVNFENPGIADFRKFSAFLKSLLDSGNRVFVHCAANYRVSAFLFAHRVIVEKVAPNEARAEMLKIWEPDSVWQQFLDDLLQGRSEESRSGPRQRKKQPLSSANGE
jgi:protein tyrosine phosphatase (PTP) superfamily phosphohydrolase (DUF442 family)